MENRFAIALDVGGTSIMSALVSMDGHLIDQSYRMTVIDSKGSADKIINTFIEPMELAFRFAGKNNLEIAGISLGIPGPFDCENGISLIKGVDKYESIYGMNLRTEFRKRLGLENQFPIMFEFDGWSFVRGEAWQGAGKSFNRLIGLTLGTGFGSGFMIDDEMVDTGPGVPELGWIGGIPYRYGILDDRISRRGIIARFLEVSGNPILDVDVKDIAEKADTNDAHAIFVFEETGSILGEMLKPVAEKFGAECIVVGGQIAKSYHLFAHSLRKELPDSIELRQAENIKQSAILGAGKYLFKKLGR